MRALRRTRNSTTSAFASGDKVTLKPIADANANE